MLETERLIIRKFTPEDLDELIELRSDDEVIKYLGGRTLQNPDTIEKRLRFYLDCYEKYGFGVCATIWKETGELTGWSGLMPLDGTPEIEVGYGMKKEFWGKGIGYECAAAWLDYGFNEAGL
jgi:RimJ/RimL family protein N-acetyltransferase